MKDYTGSTLERMSVDELVDHAKNEFDVIVDPETMKKSQIVGYILALQDSREYLKNEDAAISAGLPLPDAPGLEVGDARRVRVMFHNQEGEDGKEDVVLGLNGRVFQVKREVEVTIPEDVFNACIVNATYTKYSQSKGPDGEIITTAYPERRFSYSMLGQAA